MKQKKKKIEISSAKPVTMDDLGNFTEQVIFPGVERIVQESIRGVRKGLQGEIRGVRKGLQGEIRGVRKGLQGEIREVRQELIIKMDDLEERILNEVRNENLKNLQSNDMIITKLDTILNDQAAHDSLHKRITDDLMSHDKRITTPEETKIS